MIGKEAYKLTYGFGLSGIGASLGARFGSSADLTTGALYTGIGAFSGGLVGDATHTELPVSSIIMGNALTGAAAAGLYAVSRPAINKGVEDLVHYLGTHDVKPLNQGLDYIKKLKISNPIFDKLVSRAGMLGILMGVTTPIFQRYFQRTSAEIHRKSEVAVSSIKNTLYAPEEQDPLQRNHRVVPSERPQLGVLSMMGLTTERFS